MSKHECDATRKVAAVEALLADGPDTWEGYQTHDIGFAFLAESVLDWTDSLRKALASSGAGVSDRATTQPDAVVDCACGHALYRHGAHGIGGVCRITACICEGYDRATTAGDDTSTEPTPVAVIRELTRTEGAKP